MYCDLADSAGATIKVECTVGQRLQRVSKSVSTVVGERFLRLAALPPARLRAQAVTEIGLKRARAEAMRLRARVRRSNSGGGNNTAVLPHDVGEVGSDEGENQEQVRGLQVHC
jgi:hypothetical protein